MGEKSNQITREIEQQRAELGSNLQHLEEKVKVVTDWRRQFERNPLTMIGIAFGGGVLLSRVTGGRHGSRSYARQIGNGHPLAPGVGTVPKSDRATNSELKRASDTWDTIKGALIGVAAGKIQTFLKETVPEFNEEFGKVRKRDHPELSAENRTTADGV